MILRMSQLSTKRLPDGKRMLTEPFEYRDVEVSLIGRRAIPQGFITDYSSIPDRLASFMPRWSKLDRAGVVHDYLYRTPPFSGRRRAQADRVWRRIARSDTGSRYHAWKGWLALRLFGWTSYGDWNPHVAAARAPNMGD